MFALVPPRTRPTFTVVPPSESPCTPSMKRASAQIALIPEAMSLPACAALPRAVTFSFPVPLRCVTIASFIRPASNTSPAAPPRASASITRRPSTELISSSDTDTNASGSHASTPMSESAASAVRMIARPPFMSRTPGPYARTSSRRKPTNVPRGNTVSWCPTRSVPPRPVHAGVVATRWLAAPSPGRRRGSSPGSANPSSIAVTIRSQPS